MSTLDGTPETSMSEPLEPAEPGALSPPGSKTPPLSPPGPPLDRVEPLNLARRPFLNSRPVVRVSLLLLLLGLTLLLWNAVQFQRYLSESADKRAQIEQGEREVTRQREAGAKLKSDLAALNLEQRNLRVEFLNGVIAERTFSWSLLLDRLADVMPNDVRLLRLTPKTDGNERQGGQGRGAGRGFASQNRIRMEGAEQQVPLEISGETRSDEALLQFVDNLFAHPSFDDPNLTQEARVDEAGNLVTFNLTVQYVPGGTPQNVVIEEMPAPGSPGGNRP